LMVDTLNLPDRLATYERAEIERFLRQNHGHLSNPVTVFGLSNAGLWTTNQASADGNVLADEIRDDRKSVMARRMFGGTRGMPSDALFAEDPPGLTALKALGEIGMAELRSSGRKLLIWVGPGWGVGSGRYFHSILNRQQLFEAIDWFSTLLREARITLYSTSVGEAEWDKSREILYRTYLAGVKSPQDATENQLERKVIAVQSGGRVLDPSDDLTTNISATGLSDRVPEYDLVAQINRCVLEGSTFYTLSFNPAPTERSDEYHDLEVRVGVPGLTARTNTGYYDQPYFYDEPRLAAKRVTVAQLGQVLTASGGSDKELARELLGLELTERLSGAKLSAWMAGLHGKRSRQALLALADASAFLDPPADSPDIAAPDAAGQRRMLAMTAQHLSETYPKLPNFFATQTTIRIEETPEHYDWTGTKKVAYEPLHWVDTSKVTVLYRKGAEIVEASATNGKQPKAETGGLTARGAFGPVLRAVSDAIAIPGDMTWARCEPSPEGPRAVFRYVVPDRVSTFEIGYCCLPDGDGTRMFRKLAGYGGEIAIDAASGAVLRLTLKADLKPDLPMNRADTLVVYGPVNIGGKTYMSPIRSVSISRARTVKVLTAFGQSFRIFGPYRTMVNDVTFDDYHMFRGESRLLTGYEAVGDEKLPGSSSSPVVKSDPQ
jgi:hypothetical protein